MLGQPAKHLRHPIFRALFEILQERGHQPLLVTNVEFLARNPADADVVLLKTFHHDAQVLAKAREFAAAGKRVINAVDAIEKVADRPRTDSMLAVAGLPVPPSVVDAGDATRVRPPYVRKPRNNFVHDVSFVDAISDGPLDPAYYYQQRVPNDGMDRKLYVIASHVVLVTRPATHLQDFDRKLREARTVLPPPPEWRAWALRVGSLTGLEVYGVDLVGCPGEFSIIDVNPFPGFMGVPDAPTRLADLIETK